MYNARHVHLRRTVLLVPTTSEGKWTFLPSCGTCEVVFFSPSSANSASFPKHKKLPRRVFPVNAMTEGIFFQLLWPDLNFPSLPPCILKNTPAFALQREKPFKNQCKNIWNKTAQLSLQQKCSTLGNRVLWGLPSYVFWFALKPRSKWKDTA